MIVLGIDPGIAIAGWAIVSEEKGKVKLLSSGAFTSTSKSSTAERLEMLSENLSRLIKKEKLDAASLESLFFNTNAKTALIVGQARGVVQLALSQQKIPIIEYTPLQVKMALTGYGRADKNQIQQMVKTILNLPKILTPDDVADAAAIALTHCFSYKMKSSILHTNFQS
ncbi:crossover junction endodeoxyribonuclease RuvC [Candidatus Gottesmanbacteria bacterium]|nr:crossover junction endodeoxyribonuclease RuvC [Candidatus Gottesmanbacteria bacterium]